MWKAIQKLHRGERGITGLETAIILIAFVVVASVFAYTVLSAGLFTAQEAKETIHSGLEEASGTMEIKGSVIANDTDGDGDVDNLEFVVANSAAGGSIDLTAPSGDAGTGLATGTVHKTIVSYWDKYQKQANVYWTASLIGYGEDDNQLETNEQMLMTVYLNGLTTQPLIKDTDFTVEIKPTVGSVLTIPRRTPPVIGNITDLF